jgi:hypothetical protein
MIRAALGRRRPMPFATTSPERDANSGKTSRSPAVMNFAVAISHGYGGEPPGVCPSLERAKLGGNAHFARPAMAITAVFRHRVDASVTSPASAYRPLHRWDITLRATSPGLGGTPMPGVSTFVSDRQTAGLRTRNHPRRSRAEPLLIHLIFTHIFGWTRGYGFSAPKGRDTKAQAAGLGFRNAFKPSPERAHYAFGPARPRGTAARAIAPFQGSVAHAGFPRPSAWALLLRPFGAENRHRPRQRPLCPAENVGHDQLNGGGEFRHRRLPA